MYDLVVRHGMVFDGSGAAGFEADIGIASGKIAAIGQIAERGAEEIDASGCIVTPGFIDLHTHYDGQATWESRMQPSSGHGITTVIGGNCGVGFAPCREADRETLVRLMEGVEDVPEIVMTEGLPWAWESFDDFLDFLEGREFDIDLGVHVPHSPIRVFVMGERGANREPATAEEIAQMSALVEQGIRSGGFGISTSRLILHRTKAGDIAPTVGAAEAELFGLADGLRHAGNGVFQLVPAVHGDAVEEFTLMAKIADRAERPLSFSLVALNGQDASWRPYLSLLREPRAEASPIRAQVFPRPIGMMLGLDLSFHPFSLNPSYQALVQLPLKARVAEMRRPEVRARLLAEQPVSDNPFALRMVDIDRPVYRLGDPPRYDPAASEEAGVLAAAEGISKAEYLYDMLLERDGNAILYAPAGNFINNSLDEAGALMRHPNTILGLGDGGAHYGMICDASYPTYLLTRWVRDAAGNDAIALPDAIKALSHDNAVAIGLNDRGRLSVGLKADLNVIDFDRLTLHAPHTVYDLPAGGRRLRQKADGYVATVVSGTITYRHGERTGALPGRLVRAGRA